MRIFIVNLERSIDRKVALQERFAAAGITVEFMIAIDGKQLSEENIAAVTRKVNYAFLPGEIGCALSHQLIYRKMVEENIPEALILEDDVVLPDFLADLLATLPPFPVTPYVLLLSRVNQYHRTPRQLLSEKFAIHKVHSASTAHSYIINLAAAKNLLDALYPVWMTADKWTLFEDYGLMELDAVIPPPYYTRPQCF